MSPDKDLDDLLDGPKFRFEARGDTYRHREDLKSWSWFWDGAKKCWYIDSGQGVEPDDINVLWVRDLPGVKVTVINETTGESEILKPTGIQ